MILRIVIITICVILVLVVGSMVSLYAIVSANGSSAGNHEEKLGTLGSPKKALIIFQPSRTDAVSKMSHMMAKGLSDNGFEVTLNNPGDYLPADLSGYSVVAFGSPVYAGQVSTVLTDYMKKIKNFGNARIIIFSTGSSQNAPELKTLEDSLAGAKIFEKTKYLINKSGTENMAYESGARAAKDN